MRRVVDVVAGKGEEGRHLPQYVGRVVQVHVLEDADLTHYVLPNSNRDHRGKRVNALRDRGVERGAKRRPAKMGAVGDA